MVTPDLNLLAAVVDGDGRDWVVDKDVSIFWFGVFVVLWFTNTLILVSSGILSPEPSSHP